MREEPNFFDYLNENDQSIVMIGLFREVTNSLEPIYEAASKKFGRNKSHDAIFKDLKGEKKYTELMRSAKGDFNEVYLQLRAYLLNIKEALERESGRRESSYLEPIRGLLRDYFYDELSFTDNQFEKLAENLPGASVYLDAAQSIKSFLELDHHQLNINIKSELKKQRKILSSFKNNPDFFEDTKEHKYDIRFLEVKIDGLQSIADKWAENDEAVANRPVENQVEVVSPNFFQEMRQNIERDVNALNNPDNLDENDGAQDKSSDDEKNSPGM